jgi:uncharacterized membrane protein (DUF4010 family)
MSGQFAGQLGLALALGLLVGLQREWAVDRIAGIRTFPLITLLGVLLSSFGSSWLPAAGLLALGALLAAANLRPPPDETPDEGRGITTEVAALVMFGVGVLIAHERIAAAVVLGGTVAVLLHWKARLHALTHRLADGDLEAIIRFVLIALVILPLVPDRSYDPWHVVNPFHIWLMVVLIVGISLGGYLAYRFLGSRGGSWVAGLLGGLISSTATTLSYARRADPSSGSHPAAAFVIQLASTVVFARVLLEATLVAPAHTSELLPPLAAMGGIMFAVALVGTRSLSGTDAGSPVSEPEAPSDLGSAITFALLYAAVLVAVAVTREEWGEAGLFAVAALSGLTDVDAITLSTARLINQGGIGPDAGWRLILTGALANLVFKGGLVASLAPRALARRVIQGFGAALVGGALLLAFWP